MYRVLVVDDEEPITDSLAGMLSVAPGFELDVYKAYSATEAIERLRGTSFDIVVTDIQMPGMSGVELLQHIHREWPFCQVIFLTGHDDFSYAHQAIQFGASAYVLKNEGDDVLLQALKGCVEKLELEATNTELISRAGQHLLFYNILAKRRFWQAVLWGQGSEEEHLQQRFECLAINFTPEHSFLLLAAYASTPLTEELATSIDLVLQEKLGYAVNSELGWSDSHSIVWVLQSKVPEEKDHARAAVRGMAESIKRICAGVLNADVSFVFSSTSVSWHQLPASFAALYRAAAYSLEKDGDIAIADLQYFISEQEPQMDTALLLCCRDLTEKLKVAMDMGNAEEVKSCVARLREMAAPYGTGSPEGLLLLEISAQLNLMITGHLSSNMLYSRLNSGRELESFFNTSHTAHLAEKLKQFQALALRLMAYADEEKSRSGSAFVDRIMDYIAGHLNSDLSLVTLSEKVYLNPSYLSRRFKELTGKTLSDAITEARISGAKHMLQEEGHKIGKIAAMVGYESAAHFTRIFKKSTGLTPQEYREKKAVLH